MTLQSFLGKFKINWKLLVASLNYSRSFESSLSNFSSPTVLLLAPWLLQQLLLRLLLLMQSELIAGLISELLLLIQSKLVKRLTNRFLLLIWSSLLIQRPRSWLSCASQKNTYLVSVEDCTSHKRLITRTVRVKRLFSAVLFLINMWTSNMQQTKFFISLISCNCICCLSHLISLGFVPLPSWA